MTLLICDRQFLRLANHVETFQAKVRSSSQQMSIVAVNRLKAIDGSTREVQCVCRAAMHRLRKRAEPGASGLYKRTAQGKKRPQVCRLIARELPEHLMRFARLKVALPEMSFDGGKELEAAVQGAGPPGMRLRQRQHLRSSRFSQVRESGWGRV